MEGDLSPFVKIGVMSACKLDRGSSPVVIDLWKITLRAGANSLAVSGNIFVGTSSGHVGLFVFS